EGKQPQPGQQGGGYQRDGQPGLVEGECLAGKFADPGVLAGAYAVLHASVDPVGGVDVGGASPPATPGGRQGGGPHGVAPAGFGFEQGELGAGVGALAAGEDTHRGWPAGELVPGRALAQQPGQLSHMSFFHPAATVGASAIGAGVIGAALPHFAVWAYRDLPG